LSGYEIAYAGVHGLLSNFGKKQLKLRRIIS